MINTTEETLKNYQEGRKHTVSKKEHEYNRPKHSKVKVCLIVEAKYNTVSCSYKSGQKNTQGNCRENKLVLSEANYTILHCNC